MTPPPSTPPRTNPYRTPYRTSYDPYDPYDPRVSLVRPEPERRPRCRTTL
ncbi:hypothetical protein BN2537_10071 [Streptomyces venezuelae]|nr:hypothetical protein BN2537_10071 [Streptomyces venezuelae]